MKTKKGRLDAFEKNQVKISLDNRRQSKEGLIERFPSYANHAVYCFLSRHDRGLFLPCAGAMSKVNIVKFAHLCSSTYVLFTFDTITHGCLAMCFVFLVTV